MNIKKTRFSCLTAFLSCVAFPLLVSTDISAAEFTNFMGIKLVDIPAGSFDMGSCKMTEGMRKENRKRSFLGLPTVKPECGEINVNANENEIPRHKVSIRKFKLASTPVTSGQYKKYLEAIGETKSKDDWGLYNEEFIRLNSYGENAPVVQVAWHEAQEFIRWLNENKPNSDKHIYRMPSEAEWEYACRAGKKQKFCGSDNVFDVGWVNRNESDHQHEVASKKANAWGLYDMSGSIWQWVEDVYHDNYVGAPSDGSAWTTLSMDANVVLQRAISQVESSMAKRTTSEIEGALTIERLNYDARSKERRGVPLKSEAIASRVLRGGSWRFSEAFSQATYRLAGEPGNWYYGNGFRIAATLP